MQARSLACTRTTCRPFSASRRCFVVKASASDGAPSRPGGGAARFSLASSDEVPSDAEGDVPVVALRPSGGAFRGLPTPEPGTAGAVGALSFDRPGGGATRFNAPGAAPQTPAPGGPYSPVDMTSRPAGGAARMFPSGLSPAAATGGGGGSGGGPAGGDGGSGGGGSGGAGGAPGGGEEPLGFSSLAPWALGYLGVCAGLYWVHENFIKKAPAAAAPAAAAAAAPAAAPAKSCCKGKGGKGK